MYEELFATIITKEELTRFISALEILQNSLYSVKTSILDQIDTVIPYDKKELFLMLCQKNHVVLENTQSLKQAIHTIREEATHLPIIALTIAYSPTEEQLQEISSWFGGQVGQHYIFDVSINAGIVGGAIVSANGLYKDFTLQRYLKEHYRTDTK